MFFDPWALPDSAGEDITTPEFVGERTFREVSAQWLSGLAVITSRKDDGTPVGLTMSAVAPLSLKPPQYLICLSKSSSTLSTIRESGRFCINILSAAQQQAARIMASKASDKFDHVECEGDKMGPPELKAALARIQCAVRALTPSGDHVIVVGDVSAASTSVGEPLGYFASRMGRVDAELVTPSETMVSASS